MKLRNLLLVFVLVWAAAAFFILFSFDSLEQASNFGESFGAVSALLSSVALALAIYSMILQQKQNEQFEKHTLGALEQQSATIKIVQSNLEEQLATAKITAITALIDREEQRIENLKQWGKQQGDPMKYDKGITAAAKRIEEFNQELMKHAKD